MAVKIPNLIQRNGIYYFRCRIPSNLTDGQYREIKISLKKRQFDSLLLCVIIKVCYKRLAAYKRLLKYL